MRTAPECLSKARDCEDLALACIDRDSRSMMRETAQFGRTLANNAELAEKRASNLNQISSYRGAEQRRLP